MGRCGMLGNCLQKGVKGVGGWHGHKGGGRGQCYWVNKIKGGSYRGAVQWGVYGRGVHASLFLPAILAGYWLVIYTTPQGCYVWITYTNDNIVPNL